MNDFETHIDALIARVLSGEATPAEHRELEQWMDQSAENRKRFNDIRFADTQAVASHRVVEVDVDKAWQKMRASMHAQPTQTVSQKHRTLTLPVWLQVAALVVLVSGLAVWLYRQSDRTLQAPTFVAAADSVVQHLLADSSLITLNSNSQIEYAANYGKKERRVALTGEAFFQVQHNTEKPFVVETANTFVKVTGTSFNIRGAQSDSLVEVYVKTGSVLFFTANNQGIALQAGEVGIYNKNRNTFTKTVVAETNALAYVNRTFVFYNTTLREVLRQLNRVYKVKVELANPLVGDCLITVSFNDNDLKTILSILAETLNLTIEQTDDRYRLVGDACFDEANEP